MARSAASYGEAAARTARGYDVDYREFNGGHNYARWRGGLADGPAHLLG
ncbi:hypothetical protein [Kitasatospora aureofaciens]